MAREANMTANFVERFACWIWGHATAFKHPQQSRSECARCKFIIDRGGKIVAAPLKS